MVRGHALLAYTASTLNALRGAGVLLARQHRFLAAALQHLDAMYTAAQTPNPPPVIVVGHSMGGVLACSVAQGLPGALLQHVSPVNISSSFSLLSHTDVVGAVLALAAPLANSPWMGQARPHRRHVSHPCTLTSSPSRSCHWRTCTCRCQTRR